MFEGTLARKYSNNLVFHSLIRTFELRSKALSLGNSQINLVFHSLIRTFVTDTVNSISFYNII